MTPTIRSGTNGDRKKLSGIADAHILTLFSQKPAEKIHAVSTSPISKAFDD